MFLVQENWRKRKKKDVVEIDYRGLKHVCLQEMAKKLVRATPENEKR
jgi:hypothetical protein